MEGNHKPYISIQRKSEREEEAPTFEFHHFIVMMREVCDKLEAMDWDENTVIATVLFDETMRCAWVYPLTQQQIDEQWEFHINAGAVVETKH